MFAYFDDTIFPKVFITLKLDNITPENWINFTQKWESYDKLKKPYTFIFKTEGKGLYLTTYISKISAFIKTLKERKKNYKNVYLSKSICVCNNIYKKYILKCVFSIQKPVAPVYIIEDEDNITKLYNSVTKHPQLYSSNVTAYFP